MLEELNKNIFEEQETIKKFFTNCLEYSKCLIGASPYATDELATMKGDKQKEVRKRYDSMQMLMTKIIYIMQASDLIVGGACPDPLIPLAFYITHGGRCTLNLNSWTESQYKAFKNWLISSSYVEKRSMSTHNFSKNKKTLDNTHLERKGSQENNPFNKSRDQYELALNICSKESQPKEYFSGNRGVLFLCFDDEDRNLLFGIENVTGNKLMNFFSPIKNEFSGGIHGAGEACDNSAFRCKKYYFAKNDTQSKTKNISVFSEDFLLELEKLGRHVSPTVPGIETNNFIFKLEKSKFPNSGKEKLTEELEAELIRKIKGTNLIKILSEPHFSSLADKSYFIKIEKYRYIGMLFYQLYNSSLVQNKTEINSILTKIKECLVLIVPNLKENLNELEKMCESEKCVKDAHNFQLKTYQVCLLSIQKLADHHQVVLEWEELIKILPFYQNEIGKKVLEEMKSPASFDLHNHHETLYQIGTSQMSKKEKHHITNPTPS